jgi:hypothetical protein
MAQNKASTFVAIGAILAIIGVCIFCAGGYKSVMIDPEDGPLVGDAVRLNAGHYRALVLNYPEIFNCATLNDELYESAAITGSTTAYPDSYYRIANEDIRDSARAYCRNHDGEQAWTFAFFLPATILVIILAFVALIRKSGYTLGLAGVGLSAFLVGFTAAILIHYQGHSYIVEAISQFSDCDDVTEATKNVIRGFQSNVVTATATTSVSAFENSLFGPTPRRGWVCEDDVDYDSDLRTAAYLVYGGAAVMFFAGLFLIIGFSYVVRPIITPASAFGVKAEFRSADVDFEEEYEVEYYTET